MFSNVCKRISISRHIKRSIQQPDSSIDRQLSSNKMTTKNQKLIENFTKLAESEIWWDDNNHILKSLHKLHIVRMPYIIEQIKERHNMEAVDTGKLLEELRILDVGCGCGFISEDLAKLGAQVTAFDPSDTVIQLAKKHAKLEPTLEKKINYSVSTMEDFCAVNKDQYDVVISSHVVDFVENPDYFLELCCNKVKPGGTLIIDAKNRTFFALVYLNFWLTYVTKIAGKNLFPWRKFRKPHEITSVMKNSGFHNIKVVGLPMTGNGIFSISEDTRVWYSVTATKKYK